MKYIFIGIAAYIAFFGWVIIRSEHMKQITYYRATDSAGNQWENLRISNSHAGYGSVRFIKTDGTTLTLRGNFTYEETSK